MSDNEVSHIEILEEIEDDKEVKTESKSPIVKILADMDGWKRDAKKIGYAVLLILILFLAYGSIKKAKNIINLGVRFHAPIEVVKFQKYENADEKIAFSFPGKYILDEDKQKKFGSDYLTGFHLNSDMRTGCDVRKTELGINFTKTDQEISDAISRDLSSQVKGFSQFAGNRIEVGEIKAFETNFILTDPLGNNLHITQTMLSGNGKNYLLVCGSGEAQYEFFQNDFGDFIDSFRLI